MPIYEYICRDCRRRFEAIVMGGQQPQCPLCQGTNLDQQVSVFSVGGTTRAGAAAAAGCDPGG